MTQDAAVLKQVPTIDVIPSKRNPRFMADPKFPDFVKNIAVKGILQPLYGRPYPKNPSKVEICFGHRRHKAAIANKFETVPVLVREMNDQEFHEATNIENMQRADLHPLEEGRGIQMLIDDGWAIEDIAANIGKTPKWVARRAQLAKLSAKWQKLIETNADIQGLPAAHLELIARLPANQQDEWIDEFKRDTQGGYIPRISELQRSLVRDQTELASFPWKLDDDALDPKAGACNVCPKRSSQSPLLFDEIEGDEDGRKIKGDRCLDKECFERKGAAFVKLTMSALKSEHGSVSVVTDYNTPESLKKIAGGSVVDRYSVREAKKGEKGAVPAISLTDGKVRTGWVVSNRHSSASGGSSAKKSGPMSDKEKRARLADRRFNWIADRVREALEKSDNDLGVTDAEALALVSAFGTDHNSDYLGGAAAVNRGSSKGDAWSYYDANCDKISIKLIQDLSKSIKEVLLRRLRSESRDAKARAAEAERIAELIEFDFKTLHAQAEVEIPTPKSWGDSKEKPVAKKSVKESKPKKANAKKKAK